MCRRRKRKLVVGVANGVSSFKQLRRHSIRWPSDDVHWVWCDGPQCFAYCQSAAWIGCFKRVYSSRNLNQVAGLVEDFPLWCRRARARGVVQRELKEEKRPLSRRRLCFLHSAVATSRCPNKKWSGMISGGGPATRQHEVGTRCCFILDGNLPTHSVCHSTLGNNHGTPFCHFLHPDAHPL